MSPRPQHASHRRQVPGAALAAVLAVVVGVGAWAAVTGGHGSAHHSASPTTGTGSSTSTTAPPTLATFSGPAGVEAAWVVAENRRPGTTSWRINGKPPGTISGYASDVSAKQGDVVSLYVTTDAPSFHVDAYRMGYYQGMGARLVWSSAAVHGKSQPPCPVTPGTNMVSCANWTASLHVPVTAAFLQGDYLLKLVGSGGQQSYVPLTVYAPASHATYLIKNDVFTWQAWNPYGGYDFYAGPGSCPPGVYPLCTRARVVSFDRPYGYGQGAGDFFGNDYPFVEFAEQHGLDVAYTTDVNVEEGPSVVLQHKVLLSLGHDECWSLQERQAAQNAEQHGVNMVFFGASPILRHVRMQPSPRGPDREEVDYRDSSSDPLDASGGNPLEVTGNTWSSPPASWSEVPFVGEGYSGYLEPGDAPVPLVVTDASSWIYRGTGLHNGSRVPGVLDSDFDQFEPGAGPANVQILAHSPMPVSEVQTSTSSPYSDMTYYSDPKSGAGVFDTGTCAWVPDLGSISAIDQMTANLLAVFGHGPAGRTAPSTANWQQIYG